MIQYEIAKDIAQEVADIVSKLKMFHVDQSRLICVRSKGSNSKKIIARCHGLPKIMQLALNQRPCYIIEVISERFDRLSKEDQIKVLIHEVMHIPHSFGGGFRHHRPYVTQGKVEAMYRKYVKLSHNSSKKRDT
jgi:predicted metallopeptidase